jgi:hypothetical protein
VAGEGAVDLSGAKLRAAVRMQDAASDVPTAGDGHLDGGETSRAFILESIDQPTIRFENRSLIAQQ